MSKGVSKGKTVPAPRRVTLQAKDEFDEVWTFEIDRLTVAEWDALKGSSDEVYAAKVNLELMAGELGDHPADVRAKCLLVATRFFMGVRASSKTLPTT